MNNENLNEKTIEKNREKDKTKTGWNNSQSQITSGKPLSKSTKVLAHYKTLSDRDVQRLL